MVRPDLREPGASPLERVVHAGEAARRAVLIDGIERHSRERRHRARRAGAPRLLRYVESGRLEAGEAAGAGSDFEREVRSRLEGHGFSVDPQVGVGAYRIDLAVRHPGDPSIYLAGIACDGAAFHDARSARERDRLRESVLQGLGWNILRVWSTDWFSNPDGQTAKLVDELLRLVEQPVVAEGSSVADESAHGAAVVAERSVPADAASDAGEVAAEAPLAGEPGAGEPVAEAGSQDAQAASA
jgi:very-short-patch-repair endonuclease